MLKAWNSRSNSEYTAKSYIQDGLIAMWDGIENAGWGVHDPNATVWKDLVGSIAVNRVGNPVFNSNHCYFDGDSYFNFSSQFFKDIISAKNFTQETISSIDSFDYSRYPSPATFCGRRACAMNYKEEASSYSGKAISWNMFNSYGDVEAIHSVDTAYYAGLSLSSSSSNNKTIIFAESSNKVIVNLTSNYTFPSSGPSSSNCIIGGFSANGSSTPDTGKMKGKVYCIRFYNRKLSVDEHLNNLKIDDIRFGLVKTT